VITVPLDMVGTGQLDARAGVKEERGGWTLATLGAMESGAPPTFFERKPEYLDQAVSALLDGNWQAKVIWGGKVH
jgi:hypothetical protein